MSKKAVFLAALTIVAVPAGVYVFPAPYGFRLLPFLLPLLAFSVFYGAYAGGFAGAAAGLFLDLVFGKYIGLYAVSAGLAAYLMGKAGKIFNRENPLIQIIMAGVMTLLFSFFYFFFYRVVAGSWIFISYYLQGTFFITAGNVITAAVPAAVCAFRRYGF